MKNSSQLEVSRIIACSKALQLSESPSNTSEEMTSKPKNEVILGASNIEAALEHAAESNQYLCASEDSPRMVTQVICSLVVAMSHLIIGCVFGFSGVTLPQLTQPESEDVYLTPNNAALFGSAPTLGIAVGGLICGPFIARVGHCKTLMLSLPLLLGLWVVLAFTSNPWFLITSRATSGFLVGVIFVASTGYTLEIAHKEHRGILFSATPVIRQSGFLFVYALGSTSLTWRQVALVCGTVATIPPFIGIFFFPESPRWLLTRGKEGDALKSMIFFRGHKYDSKSELKAVIDELNKDGHEVDVRSKFYQLLQRPVCHIFLMVGFLTFASNFNGSFAITTYAVPIFQEVSLDLDPYVSAILVGAVRLTGTVVHVVLIDRLGRRPLHLSTFFVMSITISAIGVYFYVQDTEWVKYYLSWLPLTSILIYSFFMGLGQPVLMMMLGEILPTNVRAVGVSILIFMTFLGTFLVTQVFFLMRDALGIHGTFWIYGAFSMLICVLSVVILPETRGLSLEEINDKKVNKFDCHSKL